MMPSNRAGGDVRTGRGRRGRVSSRLQEVMMRASILGHDVFFTSSRRGAPPGRPPMLTLHGGPGLDHTYVARGLDMLSDEFELIYYDQLGNGRSERPASFEGGIDMWADEADAL